MTCPDRPARPSNRPGLPTLRYRIGDYATFRARLLDRLTCALVTSDQPQGISLRKLNTRTNDDPAIALLDACAVVADVLTFYQERIINEGYLLTATERRSVLELARTIGYELHPGVAASTLLAFTVEETPDSPKTAAIAKGTQILSIPEQDELLQTFETSTDFTAHVEWNALKPRPARPQKITATTRQLFLKGTSTGLQPGDPLLLLDGEDDRKPHYLLTIDRVEPNPVSGYTLIFWQPQTLEPPPRHPSAIAFRQRANLFGFNAPRWDTVSDAIKLAAGSKIKGGMYRASEGTEPRWQSINTGLLNFDIRCLAMTASGTVLAGTPIGLFRSKDNGETWTLANSGLTNFNIQTIFAGDNLLAGTPSGGVFRSTDDGETWSPIGTGSITVRTTTSGSTQTSEPINTGIPNTVVRAFASYQTGISGQNLGVISSPIAGDSNRANISGANFALELRPNDVVVVGSQTRIITAITLTASALEITVSQAFNPAVSNSSYIILRSDPSDGILQNSTDKINILAGTDAGIYKSTDQGKNWTLQTATAGKPIQSLVTYISGAVRHVLAATDTGVYTSQNNGTWTLRAIAASVNVRSIAVHESGTQTRILAGTNLGAYFSDDNGLSWSQVSNELPTTEIQAIAINLSNQSIFAATKGEILNQLMLAINGHL